VLIRPLVDAVPPAQKWRHVIQPARVVFLLGVRRRNTHDCRPMRDLIYFCSV
jgi:hypothetical protein